jgi:hypothetical protein
MHYNPRLFPRVRAPNCQLERAGGRVAFDMYRGSQGQCQCRLRGVEIP